MPTFTVLRDSSVIEESVFDVDPVVDTANPFGDYCVVKMDDRGGELFDEFERGTRIDISVDPDDNTLTISPGETVTTDAGTTDEYSTVNNAGTYENAGTVTAGTGTIDNRFTGYVVERRETEQSGADVLEVESYSFDQFLRRNTVSNDQTGNLISEALADIVQNDTPVTYNASNVNVVDDQELTRGYQGEPVETVLRDLAFKSNNENFGVNDALEFFFRPRETVHIDRGIDNTQWFNYDIPELGKEAVNEVEVWYADGEESVIVDDATDKLDLQDSLGLPSPGTQRAELNRPFLTDINDAEDEGRKYLTFRNATLSGTVTTFGLYDAQPGDTIDVTINSRGIGTEFVIAATEYRWGRDETILTIVEKRGDVDDILTELNDSVQRQEMESANRDAPKNRITTTNATGIISVTVNGNIANTNLVTVNSGETLTINSGETETATTVENAGTVLNQGTFAVNDDGSQLADDDRLVNDGRNLIRDAWTGKSYSAISNMVVGNDNSGLSRSNTGLVNQTNSASVSQSLPDAKTVEFTASFTSQTNVREIGLEAADGTLITRATFDTAVELDGDVTITLTVSNDTSVSRGVLTDDGQTAVRDLLASNSPALPNAYAYGSDDTAPTEADTALGNELVDVSLDEVLIQDADTETEFNNILGTVADDLPIVVDSTGVGAVQTAFTTEAENNFDTNAAINTGLSNDSNGQVLNLSDQGDYVEWRFTPEHRIPEDEFDVYVRVQSTSSSASSALDWYLDGEIFAQNTEFVGTSFNWFQVNTVDLGPLAADERHTIRVEVSNDNNEVAYLDVLAPLDNGDRYGGFSYTFDNTVDGNDALDGPEFFPDLVEFSFQTAETRRNVTEANFDLTANDVSNNFYVELANDGSTFTRVNNSSTGSVTFAGGERGVDTNVGLSRFGTDTSTPATGTTGQQIDVWNLFANPDAIVPDNIGETVTRAVVSPGTITGQTVREAGLKSDSTLLTRHVLADFTVLSGQRLASAESTLFTGDN